MAKYYREAFISLAWVNSDAVSEAQKPRRGVYM